MWDRRGSEGMDLGKEDDGGREERMEFQTQI